MEPISSAALLLLASLSAPNQPPNVSKSPGSQQLALLCFKTGEQISGMNKICYYNCAGSSAAITVGSVDLCPLSINR